MQRWFCIIKKIIDSHKLVVFSFKINDWKREYLKQMFPEYYFVFIPFKGGPFLLNFLLKFANEKAFLIWGYNENYNIEKIAKKRKIPVWRLEDGFLRSIQLGSNRSLPLSLVLDKSGTLYFDPRNPSSLELILNKDEFTLNEENTSRAKECLLRIKEASISKYNNSSNFDYDKIFELYETKNIKKILVLGQVEDDASIKFGGGLKTNGQLVFEARRRNPDALILFKPHPDIIHGKRKIITPLNEIMNVAHIIYENIPLNVFFSKVDEVYTISSLGGFEALIHDKKVFTCGSPFYAGWGLTVDLFPLTKRRIKKRTLLEVFYDTYVLYTIYINAYT